MNGYFERLFIGQPFSENEDKKYEFCRLNSFNLWPKDSPVFPLKLAQAGFYYNGKDDLTLCFACGARKEDWKSGDDPVDIHKRLNPSCPFLVGDNVGNIPFQCSSEDSPFIQRLNLILVNIEQNRETGNGQATSIDISSTLATGNTVESQQAGKKSSNCEINENKQQQILVQPQPQQHILSANVPDASPVVNDKSSEAKPRTKQRKQRMESPSSPSHNTDPSKSYDIPPPTGEGIGPLRFERNRLETFKKWPTNACVSAAELAKQGFHFTGPKDRVQCVFCKGILRNWDTGDRPHIEHRKHFPRCPFVLGLKIGNVPLPLDQNPAVSRGSMALIPNSYNVMDSLSPEDGRSAELLGIVTDRPKHPQYAIESQRLSSFQGWPPYRDQTPQQLAEAGFWYAGKRCFMFGRRDFS